MISRISLEGNSARDVIVVFPSRSWNSYVSGPPGVSSNPNVQVMRSGGTISRYSPKNTTSEPSDRRCTIRHVPPGRKSMSQLATSWSGPTHQRDMCSHELCASNTSSRGASKVRVITISVSEAVVVTSLLLPIVLLLLLLFPPGLAPGPVSLELLQVLVQSVVPLLPELAISERPLGRRPKRLGLQACGPPLSLPAPLDQARTLEHLQVLGHGRQGHLEGPGELGHRGLPRGQSSQDRPPGRVRQGAERPVQLHLLGRGRHRIQPLGYLP